MSGWGRRPRFSALSLSTKWDILCNSEEEEEEEPVKCRSFRDPEFYGNAEEEEEELVGWESFYENVEEDEEELVGWDSVYVPGIYGGVEEEDLFGWESVYDPEFYENVEEEAEEEEVIDGVVGQERWIEHYSSSHKILLVGEGDFSFSASLGMAFGSATKMVATSLDSKGFLMNNYRMAISNIEKLLNRGCRVYHGVDATKMANHRLLKGKKFDRIIFNFPFAGFFKTELREFQLRKHQDLVNLFLENAKQMINEGGEIHIAHKTNDFHDEWNLEGLASSQGLRLIEAAPFDLKSYPGYSTKCGFGGDNDFDCNPSETYKFGLPSPSRLDFEVLLQKGEEKRRRNKKKKK